MIFGRLMSTIFNFFINVSIREIFNEIGNFDLCPSDVDDFNAIRNYDVSAWNDVDVRDVEDLKAMARSLLQLAVYDFLYYTSNV